MILSTSVHKMSCVVIGAGRWLGSQGGERNTEYLWGDWFGVV